MTVDEGSIIFNFPHNNNCSNFAISKFAARNAAPFLAKFEGALYFVVGHVTKHTTSDRATGPRGWAAR